MKHSQLSADLHQQNDHQKSLLGFNLIMKGKSSQNLIFKTHVLKISLMFLKEFFVNNIILGEQILQGNIFNFL